MKTCNTCPHFRESISIGFSVTECQKDGKIIDVLTKNKPSKTPDWCPMNNTVHPTILSAMAPMLPPPTDTQRIDWLLEVFSGGDNADKKTLAMAKAFTLGLEGRALIDKAMAL